MRPRVLVVDDDKMLTDLYKLRFREENFQVETAYDAKEAEQDLSTFNPNVIILDIGLPKISGFTFFEKIKPIIKHNKIKVIFLTALNISEDQKKAVANDSIGCFSKTDIMPGKLVEIVKSATA